MKGSATRSLTALYVAAPFSMGYVDFYTFLMPLYALSLGFDAAEVGILIGVASRTAQGALARDFDGQTWRVAAQNAAPGTEHFGFLQDR